MAENDLELTRGGTVMHERRGIMGISNSSRASMLEEQRVGGLFASLWAVKVAPTTQLICAKSLTPTLAAHNRPVVGWVP